MAFHRPVAVALIAMLAVVGALPCAAARAQDDADNKEGKDGSGNADGAAGEGGVKTSVSLLSDFSMSTAVGLNNGDPGSIFSYDSADEIALMFSGKTMPTIGVGLKSYLSGRVIPATATTLGGSILDLVGAELYVWFAQKVDDSASVIGGGSLSLMFDIKSGVFDHTLGGWLFGGAAIEASPQLTLKFGVHAFFSLRETALWPLVDVDWRPGDNWKFRFDVWSVSLHRRLDASAWLGLRVGYHSIQFRMSDSFSLIPAGVWFEQSLVAELEFTFGVGVLEFRLSAGSAILREVILYNVNGTQNNAIGIQPAPYFMLAAAVKF
ncbi:MAG: hypothetical protein AB7K09_16100 [Planctomycetota bacterium]